MKAEMAAGIWSTRAPEQVSAAARAVIAAQAHVRRLSPAPSLRIQQSPARQEQIRQRCGDLQSVQVLCQTSVTHFLEAEDPLDHPKHVLDLGTDAGLATVGGFDRLINAFAPSVTLVGKVLCSGRPGADRSLLAAIGLITPDSPFLPMQ